MILGPRGPFKAQKGPDDWWDVIDQRVKGEDKICGCYDDLAAQGHAVSCGKTTAKKMAIEAARILNEFAEEEKPNDKN